MDCICDDGSGCIGGPPMEADGLMDDGPPTDGPAAAVGMMMGISGIMMEVLPPMRRS